MAPAAKKTWNTHITERTRRLGFDNVSEFASERPRASLLHLAEELVGASPGANDIVAPLASLQYLLLQQAKQTGTIAYCARDLLVRALHMGVNGWPGIRDPQGRACLGACLLGWAAGIASQLPEHRRRAIQTAMELLEAPIPAGWMPRDAQDALLEAVFARRWGDV